MIANLPIELKLQLLDLSPNLRYVSRDFYILHNELYKMKVFHLLGSASLVQVMKLFEFFSSTLDFWNGALTDLFKPDLNWVFIYSLLKNRKVFFQKEDFVIQEINNNNTSINTTSLTTNDQYVHLKSAHAFHYHKIVYLPNGDYNFQVALRNVYGSKGLGTTRFQLNYMDKSFKTYPPSIINEILPKSQLSVLNLGEFSIQNPNYDLTEVEIIIEEIGLFPKTELIFDYIDFRPLNSDYLFYTVQGDPFNDYSKFVNKIEKACHLAIDEIWDHPESPNTSPTDSLDSYNEIITENDVQDLRKYSKEFYTTSTRFVKMYYPSDQRHFREKHTGNLLEWRVPLVR